MYITHYQYSCVLQFCSVGLEIKRNGFGDPNYVTASGPTYVAIRSAKHAKSSAYAHALDLQRLAQLSAFDQILKTSSNQIKPVIITTVDGGPDENPRFSKTIAVAIHHFKNFNLDAYFLATNAPGRSAFNPVERRMAPLSKELSGLILPYDKYGSHLDSQGRTTDVALEKKNFENAGMTLAEVWGNITIDGFDVIAEYVNPEESELSELDLISVNEEWMATHVRTSQYMLQIVKCTDSECCSPFRSKYGTYFPYRFLTPPVPLTYKPEILAVDNPEITAHSNVDGCVKFCTLFQNMALFEGLNMAYDSFCPSVQDKIEERTCTDCDLYFASTTLLKMHRKIHGVKRRQHRRKPKKVIAKRDTELLVRFDDDDDGMLQAEWLNEDDLDIDELSDLELTELFTGNEPMPEIDYDKHFKIQWEKCG